MNKNLLKRITGCKGKELAQIMIGSAILAIGLAWFAEPFGMVTGGITGIAIVVGSLSFQLFGFAVPMALTNLVLNIPLFIASAVEHGFRFVQKSLVGVVFLSIWLWVFEMTPNPINVQGDIFLGSLLCGVISGAGLGLVLRAGATTGGTDMFAAVLKRFFPHLSLSVLIFIIDGIIIVCGLFVFGMVVTLYAVISVAVTSKLLSTFLDGMYFAKAAFILSEKTEEIAQAIDQKLGHTSTGIHARGMYRQKDTEMLFAVVHPKEIVAVRRIIKKIDPNAFVTVCDVREVLGEGFIEDQDFVLR